MTDSVHVCPLCLRSVPRVTNHHLIPKSIGRRKGVKASDLPQSDLCVMCHKQLHALFDNKELAARLSDLDELRKHEKIRAYLAFIRKHPGETVFKARKKSNDGK